MKNICGTPNTQERQTRILTHHGLESLSIRTLMLQIPTPLTMHINWSKLHVQAWAQYSQGE